MRHLTLGVLLLSTLSEFAHPQVSAAGPADLSVNAQANPSVAFYYGSNLPGSELSQFDQVVVQADQAEREQVALLTRRGTTVFAYISLSEVSPDAAAQLDAALRLGSNPSWQTVIMDAAKPGWRRQLIDKGFQPLWDRGFRAFFLDNLDSYQRAVQTPAQRAAQEQGLGQIIKEVHDRFPGVKLLFNRGFELLPAVGQLATGLVVESLFRSYNPDKKTYGEVSEPDRAWLLDKLRTARDRYHLPITAVDYVPKAQRELARSTARRIAALGMTPFVSDHDLLTIGVGTVEVVPRRILALYDSSEQHDRGQYADVAYTPVHLMAAVVLEHLGYAVDYLDVKGTLPGGSLGDRYAGIVTWFTDDLVPDPGAYRAWLGAQVDSGMKVAVLDHLGFLPDAQLQQRLGIVRLDRRPKGDPQLVVANPEVTGFETKVAARRNVFYPLQISGAGSRRLLSVEDRGGARMDAVFTASWGGMAASPYLTEEGYDHSYRWIINPFAFFKQALQLPDLPAADVTTVNGRRILMVHIDGDGFPSRAQMPGNHYCGKVILDKVLKRYQIKTTVSIIEGEIGAKGKWPKLAPALEPIARDIFALPYVEVASHSYSHPFDLLRYGHDQEDGDINGMFRYDFSLKREIDGSVAYINQRLAPKDKPVKVFLWPGSAVAPLEAMALTTSLGIYNMNGGNSVMSVRRPSLTELSPMGRPIGPYYQVYAPVQNENVYTNLWRGPYYGFRDVISTFQLTDTPRRLKPINIYYHFYSGSKIGSLKVLQQAYQWALDQGATPLYASEYIRKVQDFQHLTLARRQDGCLQIRGDGELTTLRLDSKSGSSGTVDRGRSQGVVGEHALAQGRYLDLDPSGRQVVCMNPAGLSQKDAGR